MNQNLFLRAGEATARQWIINLLVLQEIESLEALRGQISMATWVMEVTEFNYEVRMDLRDCLEAAMASEATKMAVRGNMHIDTRVIEFADFNSVVKFELRGH